ncbi:MAG: Holliday junction branch migration protein RuvA [Verrucomicrobia bacterium]|nr:Holliday junction branch migration protein RuvA [Verrucomicrobiota bacterium]MCF7707621.1 Holliday junction branch migration protein RuvA [Verrucomicrobiota bacterium]
MISTIQGKLTEAIPTKIVVDVHGVGYELLIPLSSYNTLPAPGSEVRLFTHLSIREDTQVLYGFTSQEERALFKLLINSVSGVGPKIALNILSGMTATVFRGAVSRSDVKALSQISGLGKKTAERIVVELKDKFGDAAEWESVSATRELTPEDQKTSDAIRALIAMDFKQNDAINAVKQAKTMLGPEASLEELVRACLKKGK